MFDSLTGLAVHAREAFTAQARLLVIPAYAVAVANSIAGHTVYAKVATSEWSGVISENIEFDATD